MVEKEDRVKRKTIWTFATASFLNDLGSDIIYPIWPIFVTSMLGAPMWVLGLLDGIGEALVSISKAVSGFLSDRIGKRKIFIWTGYLFGAFSRVGYAISTSWIHLFPFRIMDRAGKIRSAPRDAIIADISTEKDRGRNFGIIRSMDNLGAVFGILLCILFLWLVGLRTIFMIAAVPSLIGAVLILMLIKEKRGAGVERRRKSIEKLSFKRLDRNFRLFLFLSSIFALGSFSYSFLLIYAYEFGFTKVLVPVFYLTFTATASILSLPFGRLSDRLGRKRTIMISYLFWGLVCIFVLFLNYAIAVVAVFVFYGMHKAAMDPVQKAFVSELSPKDMRASSLGLFQMFIGLCALPSSLAAGLLWDYIGVFFPFLISLILTVISIVLLLFVKEGR